jgi:hypothetical protein
VAEDGGSDTNSKKRQWIKTSLAGMAIFGRFGRSDIFLMLILKKSLEIFCGISGIKHGV